MNSFIRQKEFLTDLANLAESILRYAVKTISPDKDPIAVVMRVVAEVGERNEILSSSYLVQKREIEKILRRTDGSREMVEEHRICPPPVMH